MIVRLLFVGIGGFFGAIARFSVGNWIGQHWGRSFPLGTFVVNVSGSLFIGFAMPLLTERLIINPYFRLMLVVGFLGAYTTFSTFEYETGALLRDGELFFAVMNVILSVLFGFLGLKLGEMAARMI